MGEEVLPVVLRRGFRGCVTMFSLASRSMESCLSLGLRMSARDLVHRLGLSRGLYAYLGMLCFMRAPGRRVASVHFKPFNACLHAKRLN